MHAVILAAGCGSRMGRLTRRRPKALLRLGGRTLLQWQLAALAAAGIDEAIVVGGHAAEALPAGLRQVRNPHWPHSGPVASLRAAQPQSLGTVLLVYGDGVFHPDYARVLRASTADIAITVDRRWHKLWSLRFADVLSDAETLRMRDGRLLEIGARSNDLAAVEGQFTGLVRFSAQGWAQAQALLDELDPATAQKLDTTGLLARLLQRGVAIETVAMDGRWCEVDRARDLALYRWLAYRCPGWSHDWRWQDDAA